MRKHLVALALLAAGSAQAADFFIRHQGTVAASTIPGITAGQPYAITLVLNNDDDNANSQTWNRYHVQCALIQTPTAAYAQPLNNLALPTPDGTGSVTTGPAGTLTGFGLTTRRFSSKVGRSLLKASSFSRSNSVGVVTQTPRQLPSARCSR